MALRNRRTGWQGSVRGNQHVGQLSTQSGAARKAELAQLQAELAQSRSDAKAKLQKQISDVKAKLDELSNRAQTKLQGLGQDTNAKTKALNDQIAKAHADNKIRIKQRLAALRADCEGRAAKLKQAGALIKEALAA